MLLAVFLLSVGGGLGCLERSLGKSLGKSVFTMIEIGLVKSAEMILLYVNGEVLLLCIRVCSLL